jgi:hypothetical protein
MRLELSLPGRDVPGHASSRGSSRPALPLEAVRSTSCRFIEALLRPYGVGAAIRLAASWTEWANAGRCSMAQWSERH